MNDFTYHLEQRGLKQYYNAIIDYENELVTFPLYVGTVFVGYQRYNWKGIKKREKTPDAKYYTYVSNPYKVLACWGTDDLFGYGPLFIVEGIWDAIRIKNCYHDAIAVLTATPHKQLKWWIRHNYLNRTLVAVVDNDENKSGDKLGSFTDLVLKVPIVGTDINDYNEQDIEKWLKEKLNA